MEPLHVLIFALLLSCLAFGRTGQQTLSIDISSTHQTIDHFGASDCWSFQKIGEWNEAEKNRVADLLFSTAKGIGLSGWRFNLGGGINTQSFSHPWRTVETFYVGPDQYDWTKQAEERWFLQAAKNTAATCGNSSAMRRFLTRSPATFTAIPSDPTALERGLHNTGRAQNDFSDHI